VNTTLHLLVHELTEHWKDERYQPTGRLGLIQLLEADTEPVSMGDTGGGGGKVTGSPAPWGGQVEELLCLIDSGARDLEQNLRAVLQLAPLPRGGSRANTLDALHKIPDLTDLLERADPAHWLVRGERHPKRGYRSGKVVREIASWHRQARTVLGVLRKHELLPQTCSGLVGEGDTERVCGERALRQVPGSNAFACGACGETYTAEEIHEWAMAYATEGTEIA
jgi:hypothetical protein